MCLYNFRLFTHAMHHFSWSTFLYNFRLFTHAMHHFSWSTLSSKLSAVMLVKTWLLLHKLKMNFACLQEHMAPLAVADRILTYLTYAQIDCAILWDRMLTAKWTPIFPPKLNLCARHQLWAKTAFVSPTRQLLALYADTMLLHIAIC